MMDRSKMYISTVASDASSVARESGLGLEIAEYCTAWNTDREFEATDRAVQDEIRGIEKRILHGPFNELSPAAVDPLVVEVSRKRYERAAKLALAYGCDKLVLHSGYSSQMYYKCWFEQRSIDFWEEFIGEASINITLENVFEDDPQNLINIVEAVGSERLKLCVDIGHANAAIGYGRKTVENRVGESTVNCPDVYEWIRRCAPYISHYHIHNNQGMIDTHNQVYDGSMDMVRIFELMGELTPDATCTLELASAEASVKWLIENNLI